MRSRSYAILGVLVLITAEVIHVSHPVPPATLVDTSVSTYRVPGTLNLNWPQAGEAAVAIAGVGVMGQSGKQRPVPIASLTKVMTALVVLEKYPLKSGENGPTITVSAHDVRLFYQDAALGDSTAPVALGEKLSERQMLEALMLPSGDNIATMLAEWTAGSKAAFVTEMNQTAAKLGMTNTHYVGPSGANPGTVSTAIDQLKVAETAMQNSAFREIVDMKSVRLPSGDEVHNVNQDLGIDGILGVKTGNSLEAGGCLVLATEQMVGNQKKLVFASVLGQPATAVGTPLDTALSAGRKLLMSSLTTLEPVTIGHQGMVEATITTPWQQSTEAVLNGPVTFVGWPTMTVTTRVQQETLGDHVKPGQLVAEWEVVAGQQYLHQALKASGAVNAPSMAWRMTHI